MVITTILKRVWGASLILFLLHPLQLAAPTQNEFALKDVLNSINRDDALTSAQKIITYESRYPTTQATKDELKYKWEQKWRATKGSFDQFVNSNSSALIPLNPPLKPLHPPADGTEAERIYQYYTSPSGTMRVINEEALNKQVSTQLKKDIATLEAYLKSTPASLTKAEIYYRQRLLEEMKEFLEEKQTVGEKPLDKKAAQFINAYAMPDKQSVNINEIRKKALTLLKQEAADLEQYLDATTQISSETRSLLKDILSAIKQTIQKKSAESTPGQESIARLLEKYMGGGEPNLTKINAVRLDELKADKDKLLEYYAQIEDQLSSESLNVFELIKALTKAIQAKSTTTSK